MTVEMVDKKGPHFPEPLRSPEEEQYSRVLDKSVDVAAELDYVYKAITLTRKKLQGRVPLIGFCGAPWTLFCYMVEGGGSKFFVESKKWIYLYPKETKALLQKITEVCVEYLALQVQAGAQVSNLARNGMDTAVCGLTLSIDDPSLRFMGRRAVTFNFQGLQRALPSRNC